MEELGFGRSVAGATGELGGVVEQLARTGEVATDGQCPRPTELLLRFRERMSRQAIELGHSAQRASGVAEPDAHGGEQ